MPSVKAMQSGLNNNGMNGGMRPQPPMQDPKAAALARRPSYAPVPASQPTVYLEMSQLAGKQVITRTTGKNLGVIGSAWFDPVRKELVSLDIEEKKAVGTSNRIANFPLSRLTSVGDVVLVHDESVLYEQPQDSRYGFYVLVGMDVSTRNGEYLGKVWFGSTNSCCSGCIFYSHIQMGGTRTCTGVMTCLVTCCICNAVCMPKTVWKIATWAWPVPLLLSSRHALSMLAFEQISDCMHSLAELNYASIKHSCMPLLVFMVSKHHRMALCLIASSSLLCISMYAALCLHIHHIFEASLQHTYRPNVLLS